MCNSTFKCTLTDFLRLRYIKECGKESIESYITSCKKESKKVKLLCIGNKVQDTVTETFDSYSKRQKRHLSDVIGIFFPEGTKQLNAKNTSDEKTKNQIMLNCIECSFFSFILDTYDNMSCYNLRKRKYDRINNYYFAILSHGIQSLIRFHISKDKGIDIITEADKNCYKIARIRYINNELFDLKESLLELSDELEIWKELLSKITHESFIDYTVLARKK